MVTDVSECSRMVLLIHITGRRYFKYGVVTEIKGNLLVQPNFNFF